MDREDLGVGFTCREDILACDVNEERLAEVRKRYGVSVSAQNSEASKFGGTLVIAVPSPKVLDVIDEGRDLVEREPLNHFHGSSVPLDELEKVHGKQVQVVRIMPNTPSLVGMGMNLVCHGTQVSDASRGRVEELLSILGKSLEVSDEPMNQMTIIAAVGPTYVLPIIYALAVAGTKMGLRDRDPFLVAAQMVYGSAGMVLETGKSGEELKEMIGLRTLKEEDARPIFEEAFDLLIESLGICRRN